MSPTLFRMTLGAQLARPCCLTAQLMGYPGNLPDVRQNHWKIREPTSPQGRHKGRLCAHVRHLACHEGGRPARGCLSSRSCSSLR